MGNLLDALRSEAPSITMDEWLEMFSFDGLGYSVMPTTTLGGTREKVGPSFAGYVHGAYMTNGVVFACMLARLMLFAEMRFQFRRRIKGRPGDLFGTEDLKILEVPWTNGTTGDLAGRAIQDVDLGGNFFVAKRDKGKVLRRMRPDWTTIVMGSKTGRELDMEVAGYVYEPQGVTVGPEDSEPLVLMPEEVAHFAPIPDPLARYRGMSWLTPVLREIMGDKAATQHQLKFFENGATPNLVVKFDPSVKQEAFEAWKNAIEEGHRGSAKAYKTLYLGGGADATVIGANMKQIDFTQTRGSGETRIAAAAGTPPVIVGLSEGLKAATYCLPAEALVWTTDGPRPIAEVSAGDTVWAHGDGHLARRTVSWSGCVGTKRVYAIRTKNRLLRATGNHPVLVRIPGQRSGPQEGRHARTEWRRVDELAPGDCVVQVQSLPDQGSRSLPDGQPATSELLRWLGAYLGDGSGTGSGRPSGVRISIGPPEDRSRAAYETLTEQLFGKAVSSEPRGFRFHSAETLRWLVEIGFGGDAKTKRAPSWVFTLAEPLRFAFLAGIVDTDGSIDKRGVLKIQFANRPLVEDVRMLAVSCGIQCSNLTEYTYGASVLPNPGSQETYRAWAFVASSATDVARIPFADELYRERVDANPTRRRPGGKDSAAAGLSDHLGFFTVRSIRIEGEEPVYDLTVDHDHSFVADGVVVHNSNYQQATRRFADGTMRPLWRGFAAALAPLIAVPSDSELWYDDRDIAFLKEDAKDSAEVQGIKSKTISSLIMAGYEADSCVAAVEADDMTLLKHTGMVSVQMWKPGEGPDSAKVP
jgi:intein/homing endonuclease/phage portal protein BeeE